MAQIRLTKSITPRNEESLSRYLVEINKQPLLTIEEEVSLVRKIKQGDQNALEALVKANLRFVVSVAKKYYTKNGSLTLTDLINEGNIGLIKAAQRFDETRGFKFISYAVWWIRQSILQALLKEAELIKIPQNLQEKLSAAKKELLHSIQTGELDMELDPKMQQLVALKETLSIDTSYTHDSSEGESLHEKIGDTDERLEGFINQDSDKVLKNIIQKIIPPRDREIFTRAVEKNFQRGYLQDLADEFGLTSERIRQIIDNTKKRLSRHSAIRKCAGKSAL